MIKAIRTAYSIGFSSALNPGTWSGYNELSKWEFLDEKTTKRKLKTSFLRGYGEGSKILRALKRENTAQRNEIRLHSYTMRNKLYNN